MTSCGLFIVGTDSLVLVNHIKRTRYCIQVAACDMFSLLTSAHEEIGSKATMLQWLKNQNEKSEIYHYWHIITGLMLNLLIFVRSVMEGNFSLHASSLKKVVKWCYACDHYNHVCWVTVQLYGLVILPFTLPYLYKCFSDGYFAFQTSSRWGLSLMGIDQAHEQNNVVIEGMG